MTVTQGEAEEQRSPLRENNFNLIRLALAVLVILSHSASLVDGDTRREPLVRLFHTMTFGEFAVDGFFILSGYLIFQSWASAPRLGVFAAKRVLRIYPGYLVATVVSGLCVGPMGAASPTFWSEFRPWQFLWSLITLRGARVPPVFPGQPFPDVNGSLWTIPWEFICYFLLAGLAVMGVSRRRWLWLAATLLLLAIPALGKVGVDPVVLGVHLPIRHPFFRLAGHFFAGGTYYLFRDRVRFAAPLALACSMLVVACLFHPVLAEPAFAVFGGYSLLWLAFLRWGPLLAFNRMPDISYGVYLYAWPIQKLLLWKIGSFTPWTLFTTATVLCSAVALVSWYGVEKPFLGLKSGFLSRRREAMVSSASNHESVDEAGILEHGSRRQ